MIPPRPAVIAHGKVLRVLKTKATEVADVLPVCTVRPLGYVILRVGGSVMTSLMCAWRERDQENPAWRHSDKELPFPHCCGF